MPAQLRLFRTIFIGSDSSEYYPDPIGSILSFPYLLQYASHLIVHNYDLKQRPSRQPWLPHLPIMYRLSTMTILLEPSDCSRVLSALESLSSAREIALIFDCRPHPDMLISDNPLPVHSLDLYVCASSHQVVQRLIQKCSQSLRKLVLRHQYSVIAPSTFLPHLYNLSVYTVKGSELMSWLPFLDQHPTITRLLLDYEFTLTVQPSPNLLPNLQFLSATPAIIERLIPGRPVDDVCGVHYPPLYPFPVDAMLRPLRQPFVPVTTVTIDTEWSLLPNDFLVNIVQTLPKLRKFALKWTCDEVRWLLEGRRYSELTGNRFLSHYKACCLLSGDARTWFISEYTPRTILEARSGLNGREEITFRWYKGYRRTAQLVSGVLNSRSVRSIGQKFVRRCE